MTVPPDVGISHVEVLTVPFPVTDDLLETAAVRHGVLFTPMSHFCPLNLDALLRPDALLNPDAPLDWGRRLPVTQEGGISG